MHNFWNCLLITLHMKLKKGRYPYQQTLQALYAAKIISYAQGFMLMREAAKQLDWKLNYGGIALMWRGGCIIRRLLKESCILQAGFVRVRLNQFFLLKLKNVRLNQFFCFKIWECQFLSVEMLEKNFDIKILRIFLR